VGKGDGERGGGKEERRKREGGKRGKNISITLSGTPYQAMKNLGMDISILQVLPITEIDLLETGQLKKLGLPNSNVAQLPTYPYIPGTKVLITNKDDEWKKRKYPFFFNILLSLLSLLKFSVSGKMHM
jgi:hypothetical protein